ncbi:MAG: hypothetical protein ABSG19_13570 [Candidatus Aminicenantales bacterium]
MKKEILDKLSFFRSSLQSLKRDISKIKTVQINRLDIRTRADKLATLWVEELRSPLEYKFKINKIVIEDTAEAMRHLHILSRPNNLKTSYDNVLRTVLKNFENKFVLPIKQTASELESVLDLEKIIPGLMNPAESEYLKEAIDCASSNFFRASIVLGWCAVIDRIQKKIQAMGFRIFNETSKKLKEQKGRYKNWNKEFSITTLAELQTVFDNDLILVCEGMGLLDSNQSDRLSRVCFQYRNHSAHPGEAPIGEPHVVSFFSDINSIILQNPKFRLPTVRPS